MKRVWEFIGHMTDIIQLVTQTTRAQSAMIHRYIHIR